MPLYNPHDRKQSSYLFVDAESFRHALVDISSIYFDRAVIKVDWSRLREGHQKVFYYDAVPVQRADEDENAYAVRVRPKRDELSAIEREPACHVRTGDMKHRKTRGNEQKMVDVQLAVDAMNAASKGLFSSLTLVTGDLDFKPLIAALVDMGVDVTLHFPPGHTSEDLIAAADNAIPIDINTAKEYISLNSSQRRSVPTAVYDLQSFEKAPARALARWSNDRYGDCFVIEEKGRLRLVTELSIAYPETHRLIIKAATQEHMRYHAKMHYELDVPEW
ncbi:NYN domain-containing protein [Aurantimonas sp. 22II-16-19i]|uniref:NYN domain-containing protein n=1 Tax=Aurantimonas sp. 22II-16-19i TaxID=1317114 RepID=UPI0015940775|nr:NYN domain-containing protein [Aurantimonas sp. 22II-16-19i]